MEKQEYRDWYPLLKGRPLTVVFTMNADIEDLRSWLVRRFHQAETWNSEEIREVSLDTRPKQGLWSALERLGNRTNVRLHCNDNLMLYRFDIILAEVWQSFPEARDVLKEFVNQLPDGEKLLPELYQATGGDTASKNGTSGKGIGDETSVSDTEAVILDATRMKRHHKGYAVGTAKEIYENMPRAYKKYKAEGGRWGPGMIADVAICNPTTVGRYLRAWRKEDISEANGVPLPKSGSKKSK
jgi:hypothetical protein